MAKKKIRDHLLYIEDLLECITKIRSYVGGMSFEEFVKDTKTIDAVVRNFEIIGEASRQLPQFVRTRHRDIEWQALIDFRNVIIHEYFGTNLSIIWDIVDTELPPLETRIRHLLKTYHRQKH